MVFRRLLILGLFLCIGQVDAMKRSAERELKRPNKRSKQEGPWYAVLQGTPLHDALAEKDFFKFWILVEAGADVNEKDTAGYCVVWNMLHSGFTKEEKDESLTLLMRYGVDLNVPTPLSGLALLHDEFDIDRMRLMIRAGAQVNAQDHDLWTPLHSISDVEGIAHDQQTNAMGLLIDYNADINAQNIDGNTPLHLAVFKRELIPLLVLSGADTEIKNDSGQTPYGFSEIAGHEDLRLKTRESVRAMVMPALVVQAGKPLAFVLNRQITGRQMNNRRLASK